MSTVAWIPAKEIDARDWVMTGKRLGAMTRCSQWWLGDWIRYGNMRWGEKYTEAARITGYDVQSLRNIAYVAGRIGPSRRRDNLTWSHHAEVCALDQDEQDKWLTFAAAERLSVADLRTELRQVRRGQNELAPSSTAARGRVVVCPECAHTFEIATV